MKKLSRTKIKYLALFAMTLDHIASVFVNSNYLYFIMSFIGRISAPLMAYFVAEGYIHTSNVKKYLFRLFILAIISYVPFNLFIYGRIGLFSSSITGLFLGLLAIYIWEKSSKEKISRILYIWAIFLLSVFSDYYFYLPLCVFFFYLFRKDKYKKWLSYVILSILKIVIFANYKYLLIYCGVFLVPFIVELLYNEEKEKQTKFNKWLFYIYYPLHLFVLYFIKLLIS